MSSIAVKDNQSGNHTGNPSEDSKNENNSKGAASLVNNGQRREK